MDPHSFIARAEGQRWLGIAEKLLMGRDLVGSKTFAIRARDSDPRLELADQILAITDTLLATEKRVGNNQSDWYAILQLVHLTHDSELIAAQYRRLVLLLNPHKNCLPFADQAFQFVSDAWSVLSNPIRKSLYDNELNFPQQLNPMGFSREPQQLQQHKQHNFFSQPNPIGLGREQERQERQFQNNPQQPQLQQHNFFSQPNPIGLGRGQEPEVRQFRNKPQQQHQPRPPPPPPPPPQPQPQQPQPQPVPQQQQQQQPQPQPLQLQQRLPVPALQPQQQQPRPPPLQTQPQQQPRPPPLQTQPQPHQPAPAQEQNATRSSPRRSNNDVTKEREFYTTNGNDSSRFWTACPFCYNMYEYPRVYAECSLRCQNCKRAFQAVVIPSPPIADGEEAYFCCWGFFPLGISMSNVEKNKGKGSSWTPFSAMFTTPQMGDMQDSMYVGEQKKNSNVKKSSAPRIYIDDEDVFVEVSESSEDSDVEWGSTRKKKKIKSAKRKRSGRRKVKQAQAVDVKDVRAASKNADNLQSGFAVQVASNGSVAEMSKKAVGSNPRRQSGRFAKELGKLDLNVEFNNNEVEEPVPGTSAANRGGHGEEDNMEGIGFFEGLDEFLSSLPILSVVGDDKVRAA